MRKVFAQAVTDPRVTLVDGVFEKTGAEDGWADIIVMAAVSIRIHTIGRTTLISIALM